MTSSPAWDGTSRGSATGTGIFVKLVSLFGVAPAYALLVFVSLYYALFDKKSAAAVRALRSHLGMGDSLAHRFGHCFSFGMSLIDKYAFLSGRTNFFRFESHREDFITAALAQGRGAILLGAHVGNWEIAGNLLSDRLGAPIHYLMMDSEKPEMKKLFGKALNNRRINVIPVGEGGLDLVIAVRNALRENGLVCMHGDRAVPGQKTQKHNFLGEDVPFPLGPFAIAAATGAPVIPIVVTKSGLRKYVFKGYAPILFEGITPENRDKFIFTAVERYVGILEQTVKAKPYEWFNFYDFWNTAEV
jgi:predicted LPLAT superfamily acyltransferase